MFSTQDANTETAIKRFSSYEPIELNVNSVYATYTSGIYNGFYATEEEAISHCSSPENGIEFNGEWIQDKYSIFNGGELFTVVGAEGVYLCNDKSRYIDPIMARWQIPFVKWEVIKQFKSSLLNELYIKTQDVFSQPNVYISFLRAAFHHFYNDYKITQDITDIIRELSTKLRTVDIDEGLKQDYLAQEIYVKLQEWEERNSL